MGSAGVAFDPTVARQKRLARRLARSKQAICHETEIEGKKATEWVRRYFASNLDDRLLYRVQALQAIAAISPPA